MAGVGTQEVYQCLAKLRCIFAFPASPEGIREGNMEDRCSRGYSSRYVLEK